MDPCRISVGSTEIEIILSCEQVESHLEFLTILPRKVRQGQASDISFQGKGIITFPCKVDDDTDGKDYSCTWDRLLDTIKNKMGSFNRTEYLNLAMWLENFDFLRKNLQPFLESMVKALCWLGRKKDNKISVYIVAAGNTRLEFARKVIVHANKSAETSPCIDQAKMKDDNGVVVEVVFGKLHEQMHDVFVNNASLDMDLSIGVVSKALLDGAGQGMQHEASAKYKQDLKFGDVGSTGGHNLFCKEVFHAILCKWDNDVARKYLSDVVTKCLKMADRRKWSSIAFPALGTGRLGFPEQIAARTMFRAVEDYVRHNESNTTIKRITIVIYDTCLQLHKTFESELTKTSLMKLMMQAESSDLASPEGQRKFGRYLRMKAANRTDDIAISLVVKKMGQEIEIEEDVVQKCKKFIEKSIKVKNTPVEE